MREDEYLPEYCTKHTLILGIGNLLFGDDGFGPLVVEHLREHYVVPSNIYVEDTGTGVRKLLSTLTVSPKLPKRILLIDAVDKGKQPGEIFEIRLDQIPPEKLDNLSYHQVPSTNFAWMLKEAGVDVRIKVCQVGFIPDCIQPGLSRAVADAIPRMCDEIVSEFFTADNAEVMESSGGHQ
jgi:coenzyme F420 hydrogenase subunit delta